MTVTAGLESGLSEGFSTFQAVHAYMPHGRLPTRQSLGVLPEGRGPALARWPADLQATFGTPSCSLGTLPGSLTSLHSLQVVCELPTHGQSPTKKGILTAKTYIHLVPPKARRMMMSHLIYHEAQREHAKAEFTHPHLTR